MCIRNWLSLIGIEKTFQTNHYQLSEPFLVFVCSSQCSVSFVWACDSFLQRLPLMDAAALARSASTTYLLALLAAIVAELQGRLQDDLSDEWSLPDGSSSARFVGGFNSQSLGSQQAQAPPGLHAEPPHSLPPSCSHTCEFCGNPCSRPTNRRTHRHHRCIMHRHL